MPIGNKHTKKSHESKWHVLKTLHFWEFVVIVLTVGFAGKQLFDTRSQVEVLTQVAQNEVQLVQSTRNAASEELTMNLDDRLSSSLNTNIFHAMANGTPLRIKNGGSFTDDQLDNFLGVYEILNDAYNAGLVSNSDLCNLFADGLATAAKSKELNAYVAESQAGYSQYDTGYGNMVAITKSLCN